MHAVVVSVQHQVVPPVTPHGDSATVSTAPLENSAACVLLQSSSAPVEESPKP